jgi:hypothetical protein
MASRLQDYCAETVPAPGTGAVTCPGTPTAGGKSFSATFSNGDTVLYQLIAGAQLEMGIGTWNTSGGTLARTTVLWNSLGTTSPLNIVSSCVCVCQLPAQRGAWLDDGGAFLVSQQPSVPQSIATVAQLTGTFQWGAHLLSYQWTPILFDTTVSDGVGILSGIPASSFTIPSDGFYRVSFEGEINSGNIYNGTNGAAGPSLLGYASVGVFLDGVQQNASGYKNNYQNQVGTQAGNNITQPIVANQWINMNWLGFIAAGQVLTIRGYVAGRGSSMTGGQWIASAWNAGFWPTDNLNAPTTSVTGPSRMTVMRVSG